MKNNKTPMIVLISLAAVMLIAFVLYYFVVPLWFAHKTINSVNDAVDTIISNANSIMAGGSDAVDNSGTLTIVKGANHELDEVAPQIEALFDEGNCNVALENSKIVARVTIPELEDAVAAIDEGDYSEWSRVIGEYKGHSERMAELAADGGLEYPIIIYGQNANGDILFTLNGTSVIFAVYEEPEEEIEVPEGWSVAGVHGEVTMGEKNALEKAKEYLSIGAFSYEGLIHQLEFEKFSHSEAVYGAANCGADWNEEAYEKAKSYLSVLSFSRDGLIDQLEFDGFTNSQANYAANMAGY